MKKLTKNFIWMASANAVSGIINVFLYIYLARKLGAAKFGRFSFAQALVLYMFNFVDLGLSTFGAREVAKDTSRVSKFVSDIVSLRFLVSGFLYLVFIAAAILSRETVEMKTIMVLMALWFFSFAFATEWAFQGLEKMHMVFISLVTTSSLQCLLIFLFVKGNLYFISLPAILFLATLPIIIIYLRILHFKFKLRDIDYKAIKIYLSSSLVIWTVSLFAQVYNGFDIVMMGWLRSASEVGYFTVARRFIGGITLFSIFLANAALPRYSATYLEGRSSFKANTVHFFKTVALIGIILLSLILFSKEIIVLAVGSEYLVANVSFKILMVGVVFVLLNLPFSTALIAAGLEKEVLKQAIASAVLNVGLNFYLIPRMGMEGAALSFVYAEALAVIWMVWIYRKRITLSTV